MPPALAGRFFPIAPLGKPRHGNNLNVHLQITYKVNGVHIYNGILLSHKNEIESFAATWMDLEIIILSEVKQKEKDEYHMVSLSCGI